MSTMRITGMSGFDTEKMIQDLMKVENQRVDKVKQDRQLVVWQQEAYRDIIGKIRNLQSSFFDILRPQSNIASKTSFSQFNYSITSGGVQSNALSVTASTGTTNRQQVVNKITSLATKDTLAGNESEMRGVKSNTVDVAAIRTALGGDDFKMSLSIGSNTKVLTIDNSLLTKEVGGDTVNISSEEFAELLNDQVKLQFGDDFDGAVSLKSGKLDFDLAGNEVKVLNFSGSTGGSVNSLSALGLTHGQSSLAYKTQTVGDLFGLDADALTNLQINGKMFSLDATETVDKMIERFNKAELGVTMSYDSLSDRFQLASDNEGSVNNMSITDGKTISFLQNIMNVSDLDSTDNRSKGLNAKLEINGVEVVQSSNRFTFDGMNYHLKELTNDPVTIDVSINKTQIIDNIKNFVEAYNSLIDEISGKITEKRHYDFKPLTDDEREALSDKEIEDWEAKAKSGVLRGATELSDMLTRMRNALIEPVQGAGISLAEIGIKSESYLSRGKLAIDETVLSQKLDTNYDDIVKLFTSESEVKYDSGNSSTRYKENGLGRRMEDILKDYVRTTRGSNDQKGILLVKAGIENDTSFTLNDISKRIDGYDKRITALLNTLANRESYYYTMFSNMESALVKMQSQSSSLVNMLGLS